MYHIHTYITDPMAKPGHKHKRTIGSAAGASNKQPPHQQSSATTSKGKGGGRGKPQQAQAAAMSGTGVHKRGQLEEESEEEQDIFDDDGCALEGAEIMAIL